MKPLHCALILIATTLWTGTAVSQTPARQTERPASSQFDREARALVDRFIATRSAQCDGFLAARLLQKPDLGPRYKMGYLPPMGYVGLNWQVKVLPLTRANELNGTEYKALVPFQWDAERSCLGYDRGPGCDAGFSRWMDMFRPLELSLELRSGVWYMDNYGPPATLAAEEYLTPFPTSCSEMPARSAPAGAKASAPPPVSGAVSATVTPAGPTPSATKTVVGLAGAASTVQQPYPMTFPVVHHHRAGRCGGALVVSKEILKYEASDSKDSFELPVAQVASVGSWSESYFEIALKDGRKIRFAHGVLRDRPGSGGSLANLVDLRAKETVIAAIRGAL